MGPGTILVAAVAFGVIVLISKSIRVVQQAQTMIVERLGKYHKTLSSGINFIMPVIDKPRTIDWHQTLVTPAGDSYSRRFRTERIDLRETVYVFPRQRLRLARQGERIVQGLREDDPAVPGVSAGERGAVPDARPGTRRS